LGDGTIISLIISKIKKQKIGIIIAAIPDIKEVPIEELHKGHQQKAISPLEPERRHI
jgi:hypothetical protein